MHGITWVNCLVEEHKLFIGMLPNSVTEADVTRVFSKFGRIKELSVIKGSQATSKGEIVSLRLSCAPSALLFHQRGLM